MNKGSLKTIENEFIKEWSLEVYERIVKQALDWSLANPEEVKQYEREYGKKGRNYHFKKLICDFVGLPRTRFYVMGRCGNIWRKYKAIIAPASYLNYLWIGETDETKCVAIVERDQHLYPFKDVIHIPRKLGYRQPIVRFLSSKRLISKFLMRKSRPMPVFTNEQLQAGLEEGGEKQ